MPILEKETAISLKNSNRACLCLDLGEKKIGVAKSDAGWVLASPLKVLENKKFSVIAKEICDLIIENEIILLVIGLPNNADGSTSKKNQSIMQFGRNLIKFYSENFSVDSGFRQNDKNMDKNIDGLNVYFQDERFSTVISHHTLAGLGLTEGMKKKFIDKLAAAQILQNFLDGVR